MSIEEAWQQTQAEKLTLLVAESKTGYFGVNLSNPGNFKPYQARVMHDGKHVHRDDKRRCGSSCAAAEPAVAAAAIGVAAAAATGSGGGV